MSIITVLFSLFACGGKSSQTLSTELMAQLQSEKPNLLVDKSEGVLYLVRDGMIAEKDGMKIQWEISLGRGANDGDKQKEGDKRTPEGLYRYSDYSASSSYHGSLLIHYPNTIDADEALSKGEITKALRDEIARAEQKEIAPPMTTGMGGYLLVHGTHKKGDDLFPDNVRYLYTDGCVGMSNDDIQELRSYLNEDKAVKSGEILIVP